MQTFDSHANLHVNIMSFNFLSKLEVAEIFEIILIDRRLQVMLSKLCSVFLFLLIFIIRNQYYLNLLIFIT